MSQRAWFCDGSRDAEHVVFSGKAPISLIVDGEAYQLVTGRTSRTYRPAKRPRWAPFTSRDKRALLGHVASGASISKACSLVGISSAAVYRHRKTDPEFRYALERARARVVGLDDGSRDKATLAGPTRSCT